MICRQSMTDHSTFPTRTTDGMQPASSKEDQEKHEHEERDEGDEHDEHERGKD